MSSSEFSPGLAGVVAFETEIAEPDKEGSALRYRGVDIEEIVGRIPFEKVWGLLVDGSYEPGLPPAEPYPLPVHSGDIRVDVQSAIAMLAPAWGIRQTYDIDDAQVREDLGRAAVMVLSYVAQAARGIGQPMVLQAERLAATDEPDGIPGTRQLPRGNKFDRHTGAEKQLTHGLTKPPGSDNRDS